MPRVRRMPTDDVIIAERRQGKTAARMAADWEVTVATVYRIGAARLRRPGVPGRGDRAGAAARAAPGTGPPPRRSPRHPTPVRRGPLHRGRPGAARGITPAAAVGRPGRRRPGSGPGPSRRARSAACRISGAAHEPPGLKAWFDALADGRDLPELSVVGLRCLKPASTGPSRPPILARHLSSTGSLGDRTSRCLPGSRRPPPPRLPLFRRGLAERDIDIIARIGIAMYGRLWVGKLALDVGESHQTIRRWLSARAVHRSNSPPREVHCQGHAACVLRAAERIGHDEQPRPASAAAAGGNGAHPSTSAQ